MAAPNKGAEWYNYQKSIDEEVEAGRSGEASLVAKMNAIDAAIAAVIAGGVAFTKPGKTEADSPYAIQSSDLVGTYCITNPSATDELLCNLPAGTGAARIAFYVAAGYNLKVVANGSETIRYKDRQTAGGGHVQSSTIGTFWIMEWVGTEWLISHLDGYLSHADGYFGVLSINNDDATGEETTSLPEGADGMKFRARVTTDGQYLKIQASGTDTFRYLTQQSAAGGFIRSNKLGNYVEGEWHGEWFITNIGTIWNYDE